MGKTHPCHPEHELEPKNYESPYTCSGCRMQGFGKRHACGHCDYVLHDDCMFPATSPIPDPFFGYFNFKFLHQPAESPGCRKCPSGRQRYCDACGRPIYGFNYHCREKDWDLHPCCSKLKDQLLVGDMKFQLRKEVSSTCRWCKCNKRQLRHSVSRIPGWSYVSRCSKYHFHVYCVSEMVLESWRSKAVGDPHGGDGDHDYALAIERIDLPSVLSRRGGGGRSGKKYWRMARIFLKAIVGIRIGDPATIVVSFLAELIAH